MRSAHEALPPTRSVVGTAPGRKHGFDDGYADVVPSLMVGHAKLSRGEDQDSKANIILHRDQQARAASSAHLSHPVRDPVAAMQQHFYMQHYNSPFGAPAPGTVSYQDMEAWHMRQHMQAMASGAIGQGHPGYSMPGQYYMPQWTGHPGAQPGGLVTMPAASQADGFAPYPQHFAGFSPYGFAHPDAARSASLVSPASKTAPQPGGVPALTAMSPQQMMHYAAQMQAFAAAQAAHAAQALRAQPAQASPAPASGPSPAVS